MHLSVPNKVMIPSPTEQIYPSIEKPGAFSDREESQPDSTIPATQELSAAKKNKYCTICSITVTEVRGTFTSDETAGFCCDCADLVFCKDCCCEPTEFFFCDGKECKKFYCMECQPNYLVAKDCTERYCSIRCIEPELHKLHTWHHANINSDDEKLSSVDKSSSSGDSESERN